MTDVTVCPSLEQLEGLLAEQFTAADSGDMVAHIEDCTLCQRTLERLTRSRPGADALGLPSAPPMRFPSAPNPSTFGTPSKTPPVDPGQTAGYLSQFHGGAPAPRETFPVVAGYDLLRELGHGGMGVVYLARHHQLQRLVALKMIREGRLVRSETFDRFRQEAATVAQLRHTNIVQVYEVGTAEGLPYFSLEYLDGGDLQARLAQNPLPGREAAELLLTLARAMAAAHRVGIVHRDLKPANVLFSGDNTPKITDFGLAKRLEDASGHTHTGQVMGTPSYMAPEQARGETKDVGPSADVYALGAILYEMLTGRPPFKGASAVETVRLVVETETVPPARLQPGIARDLETICLKCLAKEPAKRYASAEALAEDLRRYLDGRAILARRTPPWERGWKWARRHPAKATASIGMAAALAIAVVGVTWWQQYQGRLEQNDQAELAARRDETQRFLFDAQTALRQKDPALAREKISNALTRLGQELRLQGLRVEATTLESEVERELAARKADEAEQARFARFEPLKNDATFYDSQLTGRDALGNVAAAEKACREALELYCVGDIVDGSGKPAFTMMTLAPVLSAQQKQAVLDGCYELLLIYAEARAQCGAQQDAAAEALSWLDQTTQVAPATRAYHLRRANYLARLGDKKGSAFEQARAAQLEPQSALDHYLLGREHLRTRSLPDAALSLRAALAKDDHHFWARYFLAACYFQQLRFGDACEQLSLCLRDQPDSTFAHLLRGAAAAEHAAQAKSAAEANERFEQAEADFQAVLKRQPDDDTLYTLYMHRSIMRMRQKRQQNARADLEAAIVLKPKQFNAYVNLAQLYQAQEQWMKMRQALDDAVRLDPERAPYYVTPLRADLQLREAQRLLRAQNFAEAQKAAEALLAVLSARNDDRDAFKIRNARKIRLECLLQLNSYDEMLDACEAYLKTGPPDAVVLEQRGVARAKKMDYLGALADYSQALTLLAASGEVDSQDKAKSRHLSKLHAARAWVYVMLDSHKPALQDFEAALKIDSDNIDAYNGRGFARVKLGNHQAGTQDADEALRRAPSLADDDARHRLYFNAARTYAQAADAVERVAKELDRRARDARDRYADRALELLRQASNQKPAADRAAFWQRIVLVDRELEPLHRRAEFVVMAEKYRR